jgi:hypothetical protein
MLSLSTPKSNRSSSGNPNRSSTPNPAKEGDQKKVAFFTTGRV